MSVVVAVSFVPILCSWLIRKGLHRSEADDRPGPASSTGSRASTTALLERRSPTPGSRWASASPRSSRPLLLAGRRAAAALPEGGPEPVRRRGLPAGRPAPRGDRRGRPRASRQTLLADHRVTNVTSFVGTSSPRFHTLYAPNMPARSYAQLVVNTRGRRTRRSPCSRSTRCATAARFPEGWVRWKQLDFQIEPGPDRGTALRRRPRRA